MADGLQFKLPAGVPPDLSSIEKELERLVAAKPKRVYLDLGACALISSAGMGALIKFHGKIRANGGTVKIVAIQKLVFGSFRIGRLDQFFGIGPDAIISK